MRAARASLLLCLAPLPAALAQEHRVLLLHDERYDLPGMRALDSSLVRTLTAALADTVEIYREMLDRSRFGTTRHQELWRDYLRAKYADTRPDVILALMGPSLDFLLQYGSEVFPGSPVVFVGVDRRDLGDRPLPAHVTGVLLERAFLPTLELALRLHPGTRQVAFVSGASDFDVRLREQARREFNAIEGSLDVTYLSELPMNELLATLESLPPRTVVLYSTLFLDGEGRAFVPHEALTQIVAASRAPVYAFVDQYIGGGIVGGQVYSLLGHGELAANLAVHVLMGTPPSRLPLVETSSLTAMFDWRQLRRWRVPEARLPAGSIVQFKQVTDWQRYRAPILILAAAFLLQSALIVALLVERARRHRAQLALRESEERAEIAGVSLGVGFWMWEPATDQVWLSEQCARLLGRQRSPPLSLEQFLCATRPSGRTSATESFERAVRSGQPFNGEWAVTQEDGSVRWLAASTRESAAPGPARRITGFLVDVTEEKAAELLVAEQRRELSRLNRVLMLGELSGTFAHELKQPLMAIRTYAQGGMRFLRREPPDWERVRNSLDAIVRAGTHADTVINRVTGMLKRGDPRAETIDVNDLIEDALEFVSLELRRRAVAPVTRLAPDLPSVRGDRVQIKQVLINVVLNACEAMEASPAERWIEVSTARAGEAIQVLVRDAGPGIAFEHLGRAFEPFVTTKPEGLGLGLAISRSIVREHGGEIAAINSPGGGATIRIVLPLQGRDFAPR